MIRSALGIVAGAVLVVTAYWNILAFNKNSVDNLSVRSQNIVVIEEQRIALIRAKLLQLGYDGGKVAFVTPGDLAGKQRTGEADLTWSIDRYAMIPWVLVRDTLETPYVIGDFSGAAPQEIANFTKTYDAGNGLVLFQRKAQ